MPPEPDRPDLSDQSGSALDAKSEELLCSARGCRNDASFDLLWNNPKIHTPDRRKHWLACSEHRESLGAFLSARGFLKDVEPLAARPPAGCAATP